MNENWRSLALVWEEGEHEWSSFGAVTTSSAGDDYDDELYAKGIVIYKETSFGELVDKVTGSVESAVEYFADENLIAGFILAATVANLVPLHIKIIRNDELAQQFLVLLKEDGLGQHYFLKSDLAKYSELTPILQHFVQWDVFKELDDRYVVRGRVLSRAQIKE